MYFLKNLSGLSANLVPAGLPVGLIRSLNESWCDRAAQFLSVDGFSGSYDWTDALNNTSTLLKNVTSYFKVGIQSILFVIYLIFIDWDFLFFYNILIQVRISLNLEPARNLHG